VWTNPLMARRRTICNKLFAGVIFARQRDHGPGAATPLVRYSNGRGSRGRKPLELPPEARSAGVSPLDREPADGLGEPPADPIEPESAW
jgi:hypothetical protein